MRLISFTDGKMIFFVRTPPMSWCLFLFSRTHSSESRALHLLYGRNSTYFTTEYQYLLYYRVRHLCQRTCIPTSFTDETVPTLLQSTTPVPEQVRRERLILLLILLLILRHLCQSKSDESAVSQRRHTLTHRAPVYE